MHRNTKVRGELAFSRRLQYQSLNYHWADHRGYMYLCGICIRGIRLGAKIKQCVYPNRFTKSKIQQDRWINLKY